MKISQRRRAEQAFVEQDFGNKTICGRCGATLHEYAEKCIADLDDACDGFMAIEQSKAKFSKHEACK
jgi:hypothetical protein